MEKVNPCKAFANDLLTNIKLSKTQISKIMQLVWNSWIINET